MKENPSSIRYSTRFLIISLSVLVIALIIGGVYFATKSKSKYWFNEGWYQTFTLQNGMEVIVIPNHKIPAVAQMVWYKVGSNEDPLGKSGIAHFLEHLMFKGTKKHPGGEFSRLVERNGGEENAFTGHDYTAYHQVISKDKLPLVMELESDRMRNLEIKEEDVLSELQVILEERRMRIDNQPRALLKEQMDSALYIKHPYGTQVIGWEKEMEGLTRKDALDFYHKYYAPNNAILIVAGDVTAKELEPLARKYYGTIKPNDKLKERQELPVPTPVAAKEVVFADKRVKDPELWISYLAPNYNNLEESDKFYSLIVLSKLLGEGTLSRLYQTLVVDKKIATMVGSNYSGTTLGPAEFSIYATPAEGVTIAQLKASIDEELQKIIKDGVNEAELESAKKSLVAEQTYDHEGLENMANIVGSLAAIDIDPEFVTTFSDMVDAVTPERIQTIATEILKPENRVTGVLKDEK